MTETGLNGGVDEQENENEEKSEDELVIPWRTLPTMVVAMVVGHGISFRDRKSAETVRDAIPVVKQTPSDWRVLNW